jgi:hypothetical protein
MFDNVRCVKFSGVVGWWVTSLIISVLVIIITTFLPASISGPIRMITNIALSLFSAGVFIDWLATLVSSDERCKKVGYWSGWPPLRGQKFKLDDKGLRQDEPWSSQATETK